LTTWDNGDITNIARIHHGPLKTLIYTINGVSGDTGGTLTTHMTHLKYADVHVQVDTGPAGYATALLWYISGKTVVVAYTDPTDGHTVKIKVTGNG